MKNVFDWLKGARTSRSSADISDEDMVKYTGRTRAEIMEWARNRQGVAGTQAAGRLDAGAQCGAIGWYDEGKQKGTKAKVTQTQVVKDVEYDSDEE